MGRGPRALLAFAGAFLALLLSHYPILPLPFYWDELGQFVPAALDIYHRLAWVPFSAVPNVHPPGVMSYLALAWTLTGFSVAHTRIAILLLAAAALLAQWNLARVLTRDASAPRFAPWMAALFLFVSPLFFAQAAMAQLDMPAMLLTTLALTAFLEDRWILSAALCAVAVMTKETAIVAPALFGFVLLRRQRLRPALLFALPLIPLLAWLLLLYRTTGHLFGSPEFAAYNLWYPLHPVRLVLAFLRRAYYLGISSGHLIGSIAVIVWLRALAKRPGRPPLSPQWRLAFLFAGLHFLVITVLGGAVLERYLLPVLPILYAAFAAALASFPSRARNLAVIALTVCLILACAINPPYPFPLENNLAWTTFVTLQKQASLYAEAEFPGAPIATTFPFAGGLRSPELGYVSRPLRVLEINDFRASNLTGKVRGHASGLIYYSVLLDPFGLLQRPWWIYLIQHFYGYVPQAPASDIPRLTGMRSAFRLCAAGQCVEVFRARD